MGDRFYWENGKKVQVVEPSYDSSPKERESRPELVMMRTLMGIFLSEPDQLTLDCLYLVSSIGYSGDSMAEIARKNMVSRATVSNRCVELTKMLGVPPVRAMRNESAQTNSREARARNTLKAIEDHLPKS
jgi:hypothetical protein